MLHRIFIAINLPEKIKNELAGFQLKHPDLPARWTKKENLHITLVFIGSVATEELHNISESIKQIIQKHNSYLISLDKICYGPLKKMPPRMVWATGKESEETSKLCKELKKALFNSNLKNFKPENRIYFPHITLARIHAWKFRRIELEKRPLVEEDVSLNFRVNSIEIMESRLKKTGPEYTILKSIQLQ